MNPYCRLPRPVPTLFALLAAGLLVLAAGLLAAGCTSLPLPRPEPVTLKFLYEENSADYPALAALFERDHPNIKIELVTYQSAETLASNYQRLTAGVDALRAYSGTLAYLLTEHRDDFLVLDTLLSTDPAFPHADLQPGLLESLRLDGKQRALPAGLNPYVMYYAPEKLQTAGIEPPAPNWTVTDFALAARRANTAESAPPGSDSFAYGFCTHPRFFDPVIFLYVFGGGMVDNFDHPTQPALNQPANLAAIEWFRDLYLELDLAQSIKTPQELPRLIATHKCAFWMDVLSRGSKGTYGQYEALPHPLPLHEAPTTLVELDSYVLLSASAHPKETWQWLTFLMMHEQAAGSLVPPLRSQVQSDAYAAAVSPPVLRIARGLPQNAHMLGLEYRMDMRYVQVFPPLIEAFDAILLQNADIQTTLDQAQEKALPAYK